MSPFIDAATVNRWLQECIGEIENRLLGPPQAMRKLAAGINERIRRDLERRPDLQRKYGKVTGKPYARDCWRGRKGRRALR